MILRVRHNTSLEYMIIDMNKNMIEMMTYSKVREGVRRLTSGHLGYANNEVSKLV